jgi:hypothetical protein
MPHDLTASLAGVAGLGATDPVIWSALRRFERAALPILTDIWELERTDEQALWSLRHSYMRRSEDAAADAQRRAQVQRRLHNALGGDAGPCAAACALHPQLWLPAYEQQRHIRELRRTVTGHLLHTAAQEMLAAVPFPERASAIARRIVDLVLIAGVAEEPRLSTCVGLLLDLEPTAAAALLDALTAGDYERAWRAALRLAGCAVPPIAPALAQPQAETSAAHLGHLWRSEGVHIALPLVRRLHRLGRLDLESFLRLIAVLPDCLGWIDQSLHDGNQHWYHRPEPVEEPLRTALARLVDAAVWPLVSDLRPETWPALRQLSALRGGRFLLRLLEEVDRLGLPRLHARAEHGQGLAALLHHLLSVTARRPDEDDAALIPLLRQFGAPALVVALPHVPVFTAPICAALGWEAALPLIAALRRLEGQHPAGSVDPADGVVPAADLQALAAPFSAEQRTALLAAFADVCPAAIALLRAALGENRAELRRQLGRRKLLAARALGLLPIAGPDELRQRYLLLARFRQEATVSPAGKRPYERAAAEAGLRNLALNAGYSDLTRLEWAMEAQIGAETTTIGRRWQVEGYMLTLELREGAPALDIHNGKRSLKRRPAVVSRDYAFREVQVALEAAQAQARRYRDALVEAMRNVEPLSPEELALLRANPIAVAQLERLVLVDAAGAVGLYRAEDSSLEGLHGERVPVSGPVTIAHPYALAQLGLLERWQGEVVRRRIVQPFKQVFRELYLLTPAEVEAGFVSGRLAGRQMRGRQAAAVLANLGWVVEGPIASRAFYRYGLQATFETGHYWEYGYAPGDDEEPARTGALTFWPLRPQVAASEAERRVRLAEVPPLVLSEALRDLDMVTAVAHVSEEGGATAEVLQRRGELVRSLTAALGLARVTVEERAVLVAGSLASYRVSLATGAIYLSSGQHLCIVPAAKERKAIYLPFAEGGEPVTSEIVSKVLLLSNDRQISDPTILSQIGAL